MAFKVNSYASIKTLNISNSFEIAPPVTEFNTPSTLFGGWQYGVIDVMLYRLFGDKIKDHNWIVKIIESNFVLRKLLNTFF